MKFDTTKHRIEEWKVRGLRIGVKITAELTDDLPMGFIEGKTTDLESISIHLGDAWLDIDPTSVTLKERSREAVFSGRVANIGNETDRSEALTQLLFFVERQEAVEADADARRTGMTKTLIDMPAPPEATTYELIWRPGNASLPLTAESDAEEGSFDA